MQYGLRMLTPLVTVFFLVFYTGCQPASTGQGASQTHTTVQNTAADADSPSKGAPTDTGVSVEIGGGKGVKVDVGSTPNASAEGQSDGKDGVHVDVGDGAVDVRVGTAKAAKE